LQLIRSLRSALEEHTATVSGQCEIVLGGDRIFLTSALERVSSSTTPWHPNLEEVEAWNGGLVDIHGYQLAPDDFTWHRHTVTGFVSEVLDVAVCNLVPWCLGSGVPSAVTAKYIPHPEASDHLPVDFQVVNSASASRREEHQNSRVDL